MNAYRGAERNMASERAERGRERKEGSGEGRDSGKGERRAGRGESGAGRGMARKKPSPLGTRLGLGKGVWLSVGRVDRQSRPATRQPVGVGWGGRCTGLSALCRRPVEPTRERRPLWFQDIARNSKRRKFAWVREFSLQRRRRNQSGLAWLCLWLLVR